MCGRFSLGVDVSVIAGQFLLAAIPPWRPRHNIAPTQCVPVIRRDKATGQRRADLLRWGLVPAWAQDPKIGNRMINARAETVAEKPAYRGAFRLRRCAVPADGFYEWQKTAVAGSAKGRARKQPYRISRVDGKLLALAGLWEAWIPSGEDAVETFTIITTDANAAIAPVHDRMPVVLEDDELDRWLDPKFGDEEALRSMLRPAPDGVLTLQPVPPLVPDPP
jgi:putative SOS response-associated peptidase YedK